MNRWLVAAPLSVALVTQDDLPVNEHLFTFARGTVGVFAALPLVGMNPLPYLLPGVVAGAVVIAMGFVGGLVLANHARFPGNGRAFSTARRGVADAGDRARRGRGHPLRQPQLVKLQCMASPVY